MREPLRGPQILRGVRLVAERARRQLRQLSLVPVGESDHHAAGRKVGRSGDRVGGETGLGLLAVADHRGAEGLKPLDGFPYRLVVQCAELIVGCTAVGMRGDSSQELG